MKKTLFIIMLILAGFHTCNAQQVKREGNTFVQSSQIVKSEQTKYTWKDSKGNEYPIYIAKSGSCYVVRVSKKSGKEYKQYLGKEISAEICREMKREYKPTNSK